jgi:hypothetical protein
MGLPGYDQDGRISDSADVPSPRPAAADMDWLWVLERPCPDCGFDPAVLVDSQVPALLRGNARDWATVLTRPEAARRPDDAPQVWSPLEYACHVRDVHQVFSQRLRDMLDTDRPLFASWDQEDAATEGRYAEQDPAEVSAALVALASSAARLIDGIGGRQWQREGTRGDGARFTVTSLIAYYVHEVTHHLWDVRDATGDGAADVAPESRTDPGTARPPSV